MKNVDSSGVLSIRDMNDHKDSLAEESSISALTDNSNNSSIIFDDEFTQDIAEAASEHVQDQQIQKHLDLNINELISCLKRILCNTNIMADAKDALTHYILSSFTYDPPTLASDYEIYDNICDFLCNEGQGIENYNTEYLIDFLVDILSDNQFFCRYTNIFSQFILRIFLYDQIIEFDQLDKPVNELTYEELLNFINNSEDQSIAELELIQPSSATDNIY